MQRSVSLSLVTLLLVLPMRLAAQEHVVSAGELREALVNASEQRQRNIQTLRSVFDSEAGRTVLAAADFELEEVQTAVAALDDEELAQLAARAERVQDAMVAGALTNQQITYILIALGAAVFVLIVA